MLSHVSLHPYCVRALLLSLLLSLQLLCGCSANDEPVSEQPATPVAASEAVVLVTDTIEWRVRLFDKYLLYDEAVAVALPAPWQLPTREDADVLRQLDYPCAERFVTSDGYTFGMPSATVSKAGKKTKYSVLGLWKRKTVFVVTF